MEFEKYNPDAHADLVPESFSNVAVEPDKFDRFRDVTEQAFQDTEDVVGMNAEFDVVIAEVDVEQLDEDTPEGLYFRGYSLGEGAQGHGDKDTVFLAASTASDYWEAGLKNMAVHEEAHQEFYQHHRDLDHTVWESMVLEGHALLREKKVREEKNYPWRGDPRSYDGSADEVVEVLNRNREWKGSKYERDNTSSIFTWESDWKGVGYVIAQEVYSDIIGRNEMGIDEPLAKEREWMREQVEESVNSLYP